MTYEIQHIDGVSRRTVLKASAASVGALGLVGSATASEQGVTSETEDIFGQGEDGPVVAEDGATLRRTKNGISMEVSMPTPESGTYTYPESGVFSGPGHPEGFTLWAFTFNDPDACDGACGGDDLGQPAGGGAYFVSGHMIGGPNLTLSGHVSKGSDPFGGSALSDPMGAEVHLAVAPHGALDPEKMPEQIKTPTGPGPDIWWLALFK
jgi:hypothetical protein